MDAIRKVGPEYCFLSEFWTKVTAPKEYAGLEGVGAFAEAMRARGFTDHELEIMFKDNPAKALGLRAVDDRRGAVTDLPIPRVRGRSDRASDPREEASPRV